ncbi:hypothetical protein [Streptomyces sp. NPDC001054]
MHLIHAGLIGPPQDRLPADTAAALLAFATPRDRVEHVVAHQERPGEAVIGLYVRATDAERARGRALSFLLPATRAAGPLSGWLLVHVLSPRLPGRNGP